MAALPEGSGLIPAPTRWLTTTCNSVPGDPVPSPVLHQKCIHMVHKHTYKIQTYKNKFLKNSKAFKEKGKKVDS